MCEHNIFIKGIRAPHPTNMYLISVNAFYASKVVKTTTFKFLCVLGLPPGHTHTLHPHMTGPPPVLEHNLSTFYRVTHLFSDTRTF